MSKSFYITSHNFESSNNELTQGLSGYYLGWLENLPVKELEKLIDNISSLCQKELIEHTIQTHSAKELKELLFSYRARIHKTLHEDINMSYDPDDWADEPLVGGKGVEAKRLGYYLGWLENLPFQELQDVINAMSVQWEKDQWNAFDDTFENRTELVNVIFCKYYPEDLDQAIVDYRKEKEIGQ